MRGQFGEVAVIAPLLEKIKEGFYVDIGSHNGITDSNTIYFYKKGWKGICVEPHRIYYQILKINRPADTCLDVAIWKEDADELNFYATAVGGWSRLSCPLPNAEYPVAEVYKVKAITMKRLLEEHKVPEDFELLSVDVEGHEREVLSTFDVKKYRPRVIIIEDIGRVGFDDIFVGYKAFKSWEKGIGGANIIYIRDAADVAELYGLWRRKQNEQFC